MDKSDFRNIRFPRDHNPVFIKELRAKVNAYFEDNKISRFGNLNMYSKTVFMIALYLVPYGLMLSGMFTSFVALASMWLLMGFGMAGIGLSVMHDANHMSYSKRPGINRALGYLLNFIGGHSRNWKIQHNTLHHAFTNIDGYDEDINPGNMLRFSPHKPRHKIHRLQHIYAWFLYGLMTISWISEKDYLELYRYYKGGFSLGRGKTLFGLYLELIVSKLIYFTYILVIPMILLPVPWWMVLILFLMTHFVCGLVLAVIFQSAHVVPDSKYPLPDSEGMMENEWAIHQLLTTTDFSPGNKVFSWLIGGLNFQVEHHLFPNICHVHYRKIASIVRKTAREFNLPYHVQPNFILAVRNHGRMLKYLGRA